MQNGSRVPLPEEIKLLISISGSVGELKGKLDTLEPVIWDTARQVRRLQRAPVKEEEGRLKQFAGVLKLLWPFLMLVTAIASRVLSGDVGWLISLAEHVKIQ